MYHFIFFDASILLYFDDVEFVLSDTCKVLIVRD